MSSRPRLCLAHRVSLPPIEASDLVQTLASSLLCWPAGWIAVDLFGLQRYTYSQTTALVVVFLSAPFVTRRSRYRRTSMTTSGSSRSWIPEVLGHFTVDQLCLGCALHRPRVGQSQGISGRIAVCALHLHVATCAAHRPLSDARSAKLAIGKESQSPDTWSMGRPCTIRNPHSCVCECSHRSTTLLPRSAELRLRWSEALTRGSGSGVQVTCSNVDAARRLS